MSSLLLAVDLTNPYDLECLSRVAALLALPLALVFLIITIKMLIFTFSGDDHDSDLQDKKDEY